MKVTGALPLNGADESALARIAEAMVVLGWDIGPSSSYFVRAERNNLIKGNVKVQVVVSGGVATYEAEMPHQVGPLIRNSIEGAVAELREALSRPRAPVPSAPGRGQAPALGDPAAQA